MPKVLRKFLIFILSPFSLLLPKINDSDALEAISLYGSGFVQTFSKLRFWDAPLEEMAKFVPTTGIILDVGCGDGLFTNYLNIINDKRKIIGIDINQRRIKEADRGLKNTKFVCGDVLKYDFPKNTEAILMTHLLHHLPSRRDQVVLIEKSYKSLKEGGLLIVAEVGDKPTYKKIISWLTDAFIVPILFENKLYAFNFYYRSDKDWIDVLKLKKFKVKKYIVHKGKPFSHVIFVATKI